MLSKYLLNECTNSALQEERKSPLSQKETELNILNNGGILHAILMRNTKIICTKVSNIPTIHNSVFDFSI